MPVTSIATIGASPPVTVKLNCAALGGSFNIIGCDGSCDTNPKPTIFAGVVVNVPAIRAHRPGWIAARLLEKDRQYVVRSVRRNRLKHANTSFDVPPVDVAAAFVTAAAGTDTGAAATGAGNCSTNCACAACPFRRA